MNYWKICVQTPNQEFTDNLIIADQRFISLHVQCSPQALAFSSSLLGGEEEGVEGGREPSVLWPHHLPAVCRVSAQTNARLKRLKLLNCDIHIYIMRGYGWFS